MRGHTFTSFDGKHMLMFTCTVFMLLLPSNTNNCMKNKRKPDLNGKLTLLGISTDTAFLTSMYKD